MREYIPDNWVIFKIIKDGFIIYKVLGGWSGGYLHSSSWQMNSGIVGVTENASYYHFKGYSGSLYKCSKTSYGIRMNIAAVADNLLKKYPDTVTLMSEDTNWFDLDFNTSLAQS